MIFIGYENHKINSDDNISTTSMLLIYSLKNTDKKPK